MIVAGPNRSALSGSIRTSQDATNNTNTTENQTSQHNMYHKWRSIIHVWLHTHTNTHTYVMYINIGNYMNIIIYNNMYIYIIYNVCVHKVKI